MIFELAHHAKVELSNIKEP